MTTGTPARGGTGRARGAARLRRLVGGAVPLGLCVAALRCTDPRARVAPPTVRVTISPLVQVHSPGSIVASVYAYDFQGFDSLHVVLRSSAAPLNGDSLYLFPDTTEATTDVVWSVPSGVALGTSVTVAAKVWNLVGFAASDSEIVTIQ